jgi:hypothetical protein
VLKYTRNFLYCEALISQAHNLKVTIGASELASCNETQISQAQCSEICKSNYPIAKGYWELSPKRSGGQSACGFNSFFALVNNNITELDSGLRRNDRGALDSPAGIYPVHTGPDKLRQQSWPMQENWYYTARRASTIFSREARNAGNTPPVNPMIRAKNIASRKIPGVRVNLNASSEKV